MMMCCVWAMCSCGQTTPSEGEITLNGTLAGLELVSENDEVVLRISGTKEDIATTTLNSDKSFTLEGKLRNEQFYTVYINDKPLAEVCTDNQDVNIVYYAESKKISVEGSQYNDILRNYKEKIHTLVNTLYSAKSEAEGEKAYNDLLQAIDDSIVANAQNPTSLRMLNDFNMYGGDEKRSVELFELIDKTVPLYGTKHLRRDMSVKGEVFRQLLPMLESEDEVERLLGARAFREALAALEGREIDT